MVAVDRQGEGKGRGERSCKEVMCVCEREKTMDGNVDNDEASQFLRCTIQRGTGSTETFMAAGTTSTSTTVSTNAWGKRKRQVGGLS